MIFRDPTRNLLLQMLALEEARRKQEVIDVHNSRNTRPLTDSWVSPECPHCGAPISEEGCSNGSCEATA